MKSTFVPAASALILCSVSMIATAQPQLLTVRQMDQVAAGALPSLASLVAQAGSSKLAPTLAALGLGDAFAGLPSRISAVREASAGFQTTFRSATLPVTVTTASLPQRRRRRRARHSRPFCNRPRPRWIWQQ